MTDEERNEIQQIIRDTLKEAMRPPCVCDSSPVVAEEMGHFIGMARDLGDGSLHNGIEIMRDNHDFTKSWREALRDSGKTIRITLLKFGVYGLLLLLGGGLIVWLKQHL